MPENRRMLRATGDAGLWAGYLALTAETLSFTRSTIICGASSGMQIHNGNRIRRVLQSSVTLIAPTERPYRRPAGDEWSGT